MKRHKYHSTYDRWACWVTAVGPCTGKRLRPVCGRCGLSWNSKLHQRGLR